MCILKDLNQHTGGLVVEFAEYQTSDPGSKPSLIQGNVYTVSFTLYSIAGITARFECWCWVLLE